MYETVADVAENEEQRRPNFQSGYRVLKLRRAKVDPYFKREINTLGIVTKNY